MMLRRAKFLHAFWLALALVGMQGHTICMLIHSHACEDVTTETTCSGQCAGSHDGEHEGHADELPASTSDPCCCRCVTPHSDAGIPDGYSPRRRAEQLPDSAFLTFDKAPQRSAAECAISVSRSRHLTYLSPAGIDRSVVLLI